MKYEELTRDEIDLIDGILEDEKQELKGTKTAQNILMIQWKLGQLKSKIYEDLIESQKVYNRK